MKHITREEARLAGVTRFFVGATCPRGHIAEQYVANRKCVVCQREEMKERYWKNPEVLRTRNKEWAARNPEKVRELRRAYKKLNPTGKFTLKRRERLVGRPRPEICDLCSKPNKTSKPIYFDHCHASGQFRGWLCHRCNTVLGAVQDDADLLVKMADYLNQANKQSIAA